MRVTMSVLFLLFITCNVNGGGYISVSPSIRASFSGDRLEIGGGLSIEGGIPTSIGEIIPSLGLYGTYYHNYSGFDITGIEYRISPMITFDSMMFSESLGTNLWYGRGDIARFKQRTGINVFTLKYLFGDSERFLRIIYENDGVPFTYLFLSDTEDRYRTASLYVSFLDIKEDESISFGMRLFTGNRLKSEETDEEPPALDSFGYEYPFGFVHEVGEPYRGSLLYVDYREGPLRLRAGIDDDRYRHLIQNWIAHGILSSTDKAGFRIYDDSAKLLFSPAVEFTNSYTLFGEDRYPLPFLYTSY